jgi:phage FluMu protein gp41
MNAAECPCCACLGKKKTQLSVYNIMSLCIRNFNRHQQALSKTKMNKKDTADRKRAMATISNAFLDSDASI